MPPVLRPISPQSLKECLERDGWRMLDEDQDNWLMVSSDPKAEPIVIPKKGRKVSVEIMSAAQHKARGKPLFRHLIDAVHREPLDLDATDEE